MPRKYKLNESYFETIDTPSKAYILGFSYADANVSSNKYTYCVKLAIEDRSVLEFIKAKIQFDGPITDIGQSMVRETGNLRKCQAHLKVDSKKFCSHLINAGGFPNKSLKLKPPKLETELERFFVLGYFDGDGCVNRTTQNSPQIHFRGTIEVLEYIQDILYQKTGLQKNKMYQDKKGINNYKLIWNGTNNCLKFYEYAYENAPFFLERKREKFEQIKNMKYQPRRVGAPIVQYSKELEPVNYWPSIAAIELTTKYKSQAIYNCINNHSTSAYGYVWRYASTQNSRI